MLVLKALSSVPPGLLVPYFLLSFPVLHYFKLTSDRHGFKSLAVSTKDKMPNPKFQKHPRGLQKDWAIEQEMLFRETMTIQGDDVSHCFLGSVLLVALLPHG